MKISQDVREFSKAEREKAEGMAQMSEKFKEGGSQIYKKVG